MIIVSQEQDEILNFNNIMNIQVTNCEEDGYLISAGFIVGRDDNYRDLGYYKTEERAKEVLREIIKKYEKINLGKYFNAPMIELHGDKSFVYEMPKE